MDPASLSLIPPLLPASLNSFASSISFLSRKRFLSLCLDSKSHPSFRVHGAHHLAGSVQRAFRTLMHVPHASGPLSSSSRGPSWTYCCPGGTVSLPSGLARTRSCVSGARGPSTITALRACNPARVPVHFCPPALRPRQHSAQYCTRPAFEAPDQPSPHLCWHAARRVTEKPKRKGRNHGRKA